MSAVAGSQRWTRSRPCPICGGHGSARRGSSTRCHGYASADGRYAHCSRSELAGTIEPHDSSGLYPHRLVGTCRCGTAHGADQLELDAEATARRAAEIDRERVERERLRARMPAIWESLPRRSVVGEHYLASRGIGVGALRELGDVVRYSHHGEPAVALRSLETGAIVGIQYRRLVVRDGSKLRCERGSEASGACLYGRVGEIAATRDAVIVEGLTDTLVATLAWPGCAIFGAPGAGHLQALAAAVAPRVRALGGNLLLVPDDDDIGVKHAVRAVRAAQATGLVLDRDLLLVDLGEHHDLTDAWRAGWRWIQECAA